jgi:hypothetical protein
MYHRCIRFNINQESNSVRDTIKFGARHESVLKDGAPDGVRCTRPSSKRTGHSRDSRDILRYNSPDCPVCTGMSGEPTEQLLSACQRSSATVNSASQKSEQKVKTHRTCPVPLEDRRRQRSTAPNPNK